MKKVLLVLLALMFVGSLCFAQPASTTVKHTTVKSAAVVKSVTGKVKSVSLEDAAKGTKSEIIVVDEKNKETTATVTSTTAIYDKNYKKSTLDKISSGDKVTVKYTTNKEGTKEAISIKIIG